MKDIRASILLTEVEKAKVLNADLEFVEYEDDDKIEVLLDSDGDGFYRRNVDKRIGKTASRRLSDIINWFNKNLQRKFSAENFDIEYNGFDDERVAQDSFWNANAQPT